MKEDLIDKARRFFKKHDGVVTQIMLITNFSDEEIFRLVTEGRIEMHQSSPEWLWKND